MRVLRGQGKKVEQWVRLRDAELVEVQAVEKVWARIVGTIRDRLLGLDRFRRRPGIQQLSPAWHDDGGTRWRECSPSELARPEPEADWQPTGWTGSRSRRPRW